MPGCPSCPRKLPSHSARPTPVSAPRPLDDSAARYADVSQTWLAACPDEQRREQLREQAERLNPDSWVTDEEVTAAWTRTSGAGVAS